ncbi:MAG: hypothetical protein EXS46_01705 [Candidatus Taylorbacteria bacterium]|nr:hypothetical protein [Candidatus Taylorbacteria bacterium]
MDLDTIYGLLILLSLVTICIIIYFLLKIIRPNRIGTLARKLGLNFDAKIYAFTKDQKGRFGMRKIHYQKNRLAGNVSGHTVEIYEYWQEIDRGFSFQNYGMFFKSGKTVIIIDGTTHNLMTMARPISVRKLEKELLKLLRNTPNI